MDASSFEHDDARAAKNDRAPEPRRTERPSRLSWASALGNAAVQRVLRSAGVRRSASEPEVLDDALGKAIQAKRGTGQALDSGTQREMEASFGQDFSNVRVHADSEADSLNRGVQAEAFTTGSDIFFRSGRYDPGSPDGRKLLTHELTHVVQQDGSPPAQEFTVSSPNDLAERQAGEVADHLSATPLAAAPALGRQEMPEEEDEQAIARQEAPEEEEEVPGA